MDRAFWLERWRTGQIGFHEGRPNAALVACWERVGAGRRVLVPLCGKSHDLDWLAARGHEVVGVELAVEAIQAFFDERGLRSEREGSAWRHGPITLVQGDFFEVEVAFDAFFDRAALIAVDPARRPDYAARLRGYPGLIVTMDYPQSERQGPPWSVAEAEVRALFGAVERVWDQDLLTEERYRSWGLSRAREQGFVVGA